ncbi:MAG TPA: DUF393 domain-containing protein [Acetobacteraceae bacterium]|nr:DUF393 domain-containing protein [Acetobacteraceae bacterium]
MPEILACPASYHDDPAVPAFDDGRPLFVFDGVCVLCSGAVSWIMRYDKITRVNFTPAQGAIGQALYAHYGVEMNESYLLIAGGRAFTASRGYLELCRVLGGWCIFRVSRSSSLNVCATGSTPSLPVTAIAGSAKWTIAHC